MKQFSASIWNYLIRFFYIQMFITLASLPILINWGLPLSLMSPIANLIFTPFLMAFLLLASLVFFSELLSLPNSWVTYLLEKTVCWWSKLLSLHSPSWLITFTKPSFIFFTCALGATFFILHYKKIKNMAQATWCFLLLFCAITGYLTWQRPTTAHLKIPCNRGEVSIFKHHSQTVLVDPGYFGQSSSTPSWLEYTLMPTLHKEFGSSKIDHLLALQPSIFTFEALQALCRLVEVKNLYLVSWDGTGSKKLYREYGALKKILHDKKVTLHRISSWHQKNYPSNLFFEIIPLAEKLPYHEIMFPALQVRVKINNEEMSIYSAKIKKLKKENHETQRISQG